MAARLFSLVRALGQASKLASPAVNRASLTARPCQEFAAAAQRTSKGFQTANLQFLGRCFSTFIPGWRKVDNGNVTSAGLTDHNSLLLQHSRLLPTVNAQQPQRSHVRFSRCSGKQKTVKAAVKRFYRLDWRGWIRTMPARHRKLWKKSWKVRQRLRRHVFCDNTTNRLLEHMVTPFWKKPKYFVDDPYEPYHVRHTVHKRSPRDPY